MLRIALGLVAALAAGAAAAGDVNLPGIGAHDHRVRVDSSVPPWSAIGRVNRRSGGFCTGSVIAPRTVLTAAHCLWNLRTNRWLPPQSLHFVAGERPGRYLADAGVDSYRVSPGYVPGLSLASLQGDWALLVLDHDIGQTVGIVPLATGGQSRAFPGMKLVHAGYSQDKSHILTKHEGCAVTAVGDGLIHHDCDATLGDSGSPILIRDGELYRILAVHVASATSRGQAMGIAVLVPSAVLDRN
jgi:protease YdgD